MIARFIFRFFLIIGLLIFIAFCLTDNNEYAVYGFIYILIAIPINLIFLTFFLVCAFLYKTKYEECVQSMLILLVNIPIALVLSFIGFNFLK